MVTLSIYKLLTLKARCHGLVVETDDSQSRGCGFKPWHCIMDEMQAKLAIVMRNKEIKVAEWGTLKH
jgi:hypothetical protein